MDVIVAPVPGVRGVWTLTYRLGRNVGQITRSTEMEFVITPAHPATGGPLAKIDAFQPSLEAAMDAVAKRLKGVCQLSSETDRP